MNSTIYAIRHVDVAFEWREVLWGRYDTRVL